MAKSEETIEDHLQAIHDLLDLPEGFVTAVTILPAGAAVAAVEGEGDADDGDEDSGDGEDAEFPHYSEDELKSMEWGALIDVCTDLEIDVPKKIVKSEKKKKLIEFILENQPNQDGDSEEEEAEAADYSTMKVADLRAECKSRGLATGGSKADLVARLEEADQEDPF